MKKIKKRVLECVIDNKKIINYGKLFPNDIGNCMSKCVEFRDKYKDVIPLTIEERQDALDYINALDTENYELCNNFLIID